jgi:hypothetical protein
MVKDEVPYDPEPGTCIHQQHDALDALWVGLMRKRVKWVLDADVPDFFGTVVQLWECVRKKENGS